jgi:glycosyltransferase involved in cell wall biosynthesis
VVTHVALAVPGDLATATGGYAYDRRLIAELEALGFCVDVLALGEDFPRPSAQTRGRALSLLASVPAERPIIVDGLALGALPEATTLREHCLIALVHHPLALECGLSASEAAALRESERQALSAARRVIATSAATARLLISDFAVPSNCVVVAPPGCDRVEFAHGSASDMVALLAVGAIVARKGYDVLIAALARLADLPWRLTIVGDRERDVAAAEGLAADIRRYRLGDRVDVVGVVAPRRLAELYAAADLFVLASRFEGYGMVYAEAIAYGLPLIGTTAGAIPETVPAGAGLLVPPDDCAALGDALRRLIAQPGDRARLAAAARAAAAQLPTWRETGRLVAGAIGAVA